MKSFQCARCMRIRFFVVESGNLQVQWVKVNIPFAVDKSEIIGFFFQLILRK